MATDLKNSHILCNLDFPITFLPYELASPACITTLMLLLGHKSRFEVWWMWMQAAVHYVAMTPEGRIFDNSLMRGSPYYIRIGSGAVSFAAEYIQL